MLPATKPNTASRALATILDYGFIFAFTFGFIQKFGIEEPEGVWTVSGPLALIPIAFWLAWIVIPENLWGRSLGHRITRLKVISFDGGNPTLIQSIKRRICDPLEIIWCLGLIAFILVKNTKYNQRLGDIWAKTLVVPKDFSLAHNFDFEKSNDGR